MRKNSVLLFLILISLQVKSEENKWISIKERMYTQVMQVDVFDSLDAIALTRFRGFTEVEKSTDGGETWEMIYTEDMDKTGTFPIPQKAYNIAMPGKDTVYIAYDKGQLRRSYDGGYTYDTVFFDTEYSVGNLVMHNTMVGMMDVQHYMPDSSEYEFTATLLYTKDGWETWDVLRPDLYFNEPVSTSKFHFFNESNILFMTNRSDVGNFVYRTSDAGETWERFNLSNLVDNNTRCFLWRVFFTDSLTGWISAGEKNYVGHQKVDVIFKTTDGGETWELNYKELNEPNFGLQDIAFKDEMNGIATGPWGKILRTTDGGESWHREYGEDHSNMEMHECTQVLIEYFGTKPILCTAGTGAMFWKEKYPSGIQEDTRFEHTKIYPNPATPGKTVNLDIEQGQFTGKIFDINGEIVQQADIAARSFILSPDISAGVYLLLIESEGEVIAREKFIVK